jgi:hypothetical protein
MCYYAENTHIWISYDYVDFRAKCISKARIQQNTCLSTHDGATQRQKKTINRCRKAYKVTGN